MIGKERKPTGKSQKGRGPVTCPFPPGCAGAGTPQKTRRKDAP
jgi:hypothetical protein